jgi:hypothetical protein
MFSSRRSREALHPLLLSSFPTDASKRCSYDKNRRLWARRNVIFEGLVACNDKKRIRNEPKSELRFRVPVLCTILGD